MLSKRVQGFTESVIREMPRVVSQHGGVNLAPGMPDFRPPDALIDAAHRALDGGRANPPAQPDLICSAR